MRQPGCGPGNDINAGSPGSQKAPTRSPASPGAIRPGSTLIEEVRAYLRIARFFAGLRAKAEQLDAVQRWYRILSEALRKYLRGRQLIPPARLQPG